MIWSAAATLGLCIFCIAPTRLFSLAEMAAVLGAVTGWNTSGYEIMRIGERRLLEGLTATDDTLPARFFEEPIHSTPARRDSQRLNRAAFTATLDS